MATGSAVEYEYAGFKYKIEKDYSDDPHSAGYVVTPLPDQHFAAKRDRNIRDALECWIDDGKPGDDKL